MAPETVNVYVQGENVTDTSLGSPPCLLPHLQLSLSLELVSAVFLKNPVILT